MTDRGVRLRCAAVLALLSGAWAFAVPTLATAAAADHAPGQVAGTGKIVAYVHFVGNRKAEDDAIRLVMQTRPGAKLDSDRLRDDLRAIWRMGYFDDVRVEGSDEGDRIGLTLLFKEKPVIAKIYISGNSELGLDKINEVLDLKKDAIVDPAKIKRNVEKVRDLYIEKGYYLVEVRSDLQRVDENHVNVFFVCDEHAKVEVRQIRFLGNKAVTNAELRGAMGTQEGGWLSFFTSSGTYREDAFDRDLLLLTAFYYDRGYINVKLGRPEIELSADKRFLYITIPVEEGLPYKINKIDFRGDLLKPRDQLIGEMATRTGDGFSRTKLGNDITHINDLYKDAGYAYVNVQPLTNVDIKHRTVDVLFDIQKGNLIYFNRISVRGNTKTRDKVIRREMRIFEGELYNQTLLDRSKKLIHALGFFEKVEMSTKAAEGEPNMIDVVFEVTERSTGTFQVGAGFSSVENFIGQAQVSQNNLFGRGTSLQVQGQISSLRQLFTLRYLDPYFLDTKLTFAFSLYNSLLYYPSFNRTARGGDITFGYLLADYTRLLATYKLESVNVNQNQLGVNIGGFGASTPVTAGTISNLFRSGITSSIRLSLSYDSRNDRMFPTKGMFHSISVEVADPLIASQAVYTRISGFARFYHPIWGPFIFRANVEAGWVTSRSSQGVPIYERYLIGGINTIRGFQLFSLGPKVNVLQAQEPSAFLAAFNIGGNLELILNTEIEFPILSAVQIKGVIFFDAGNAYNTEIAKYCPTSRTVANVPDVFNPCNSYPTPYNLRYSVGFGIRWFSPVGPLRFEWGIPLNRQTGENPIVFEFTIGNFF